MNKEYKCCEKCVIKDSVGIPIGCHDSNHWCPCHTPTPENWSEKLVKKVANNFLGWKLPDDFTPDCGISYKKLGDNFSPVGTNLFTATQTEEMIKSILIKELKHFISQVIEEERARIVKEIESKISIQKELHKDCHPYDKTCNHSISLDVLEDIITLINQNIKN